MEMQFPFTVIACFLPLFLLLLLAKEFTRHRSSYNTQKLPPGPKKLPFIGNLHQMIGSLPHHTLKKLADKHGPIMHLQLGELSVIVISSPRVAKEALQGHTLAFANRPQLTVAKIMLYGSSGATFSPYGDYWRQIRHMYIMELLSPERIKSFFSIMEDELSHLVKSIESLAGQPFVFNEKILSYLNTTIRRSTVGRICKDQEALIMATKEASSLAGIFNVADLFPSSKILQTLSGLKPKLDELHKRLDDILEDIINNHEENSMNNTTDNGQHSVEDILDILLRLKKRNDQFQFPITSNNIKAIIFELFVAGSISTSVVAEWAMSEMMKNPRVMQKAQAEVRHAFMGKRTISGSDLQELRYLKLVIKETLRLHPPGPLLVPRECREQCEIEGYTIPENTIALVNVWAIGRDPNYWNDAEMFEPERFNYSNINFTGNNFEFIPFGAGKRMCPGVSFGLANVELLLCNLLHHFDWKLTGGMQPQELDMTENFGAAAGRKNNLCMIANIHVQSDSSQ